MSERINSLVENHHFPTHAPCQIFAAISRETWASIPDSKRGECHTWTQGSEATYDRGAHSGRHPLYFLQHRHRMEICEAPSSSAMYRIHMCAGQDTISLASSFSNGGSINVVVLVGLLYERNILLKKSHGRPVCEFSIELSQIHPS